MKILEPLKIAGFELRNRVVFASHINSLCEETGVEPDISRCVPGEAAAAYYARRAEGGAAMVVTEEIPVAPDAFRFRAAADPGQQGFAHGLRKIATGCHQNGALVLARLSHPGAFADFDLSFRPVLSPSGLSTPASFHASQPMDGDQIERMIEAFADLAQRVTEAGLDGVEVDAGPLSVIEQFLAPALNRRTDEWQGFEGAGRLISRILERVRAAIGPSKMLTLVLTATPDPAIGIGAEERAGWIARNERLDAVDLLHLCRGTYSSLGGYGDNDDDPFALLAMLPRSGRPRMLSGAILTVEQAEALIDRQRADLVGMVRALIADSALAARASRKQVDARRPCVACNQNCRDRIARNYTITCLVNPRAGREERRARTRADRPTEVTVIGGGPAGMEAALTAAELGHRVRLHERHDRLGGQLLQIARQPMRHRFADLVAWYEKQLAAYQVEVIAGSSLAPDEVPRTGAVIVATGALPDRRVWTRDAPYRLSLDGHDRGRVAPVEEVMTGQARPKGKIVILDDCDDWKSLGTALFLAGNGNEVHLVTRNMIPGKRMAAGGDLSRVRKRLNELDVKVLAGWQVLGWTGISARLRDLNRGEDLDMPCDWLVTATTARADSAMADALASTGRQFSLAGDCASPRNVGDAIREGRAAAERIEGKSL